MKRFIAIFVMFALLSGIAAPAIHAAGLADKLTDAGQKAGEKAGDAGKAAIENGKKAIEPLIYAGKAVINGAKFVVFKTSQGVLLIAAKAVHGLEYVKKGAQFIALKTKQGVIWVAEKMIVAGEIILDVAVKTKRIILDGVAYVIVKLEEGVCFLKAKIVNAAKKAREIVIKGMRFVLKKTKQGIVWVTKNVKIAARRAALVGRLRMTLSGALATGQVGDRSLRFFRSLTEDADPVIARLGRASLAAAEAFNTSY